MKRASLSEKVFSISAHVLLILFAIACLYPLVYTLSSAISGRIAVETGKVILWPIDIQFDAVTTVLQDPYFWIAYCNTIYLTVYGTVISMLISLAGAYALSKSRLLFNRGFNFILVFTMWFSAGLYPTYRNFQNLGMDNRFGFLLGMGFNAFNVILLRNAFSGVPTEIEEAATIDGATEFQILTKVYIPMSKSAIATVTMFYALSRWNGYFWAEWLLKPDPENYEWPLQAFMRNRFVENPDEINPNTPFALQSARYAMIVCSIIPIIILYPQMQKYFAAGVNVGGVKE